MKYIRSKWLQTCVLIVTVVALVFVGCGGGGGGGSSNEPIKVRTLSGLVMAPVPQNASLLSASGNSPVANAKVWLEGFSNILPQYTDASGTYVFIGVPAAEHFVVASFEYAGKTYKQRVRALIQNSDVDVKAPNIDVEEASAILTGVLKDSSGNVLPVGTQMKLWGDIFTIGSNGSFTTPPLPVSVGQAEIFVKMPGGNTFTSFYGPFIGGSTPAFVEQTVLLPDSGNIAPSGVLFARNTAGIKTVNCVTGEQLNFSLTAHDPDAGHLSNLKYQWAASRGTLQVTGNQMTANWVAMDSHGVATVSVVITDPKGASGKVSLRVLVNIQSMDQTDTTSPTIVSRTPAANAIGVTPGSTISVVFSETLLASSVTSGAMVVTSQGTTVSGASSLQADKKTIIWAPTTVLPGNQTITVALLATISDLYGNQIGDQSSWTFSTALVPGVTVNSLHTNDTTPEITGTVDDPETTVLVTVNSKTYNATLNGTSWKAQVTDALPDGVYNVGVVATNKSGITGNDSSSNELTVDTGPKTAVLSNLPPVVTSSKQTAITVGGTGVVKYLFRHRMLGESWGAWSAEKAISEKIALTGLVDGIYNLQVRAIDAPGNIQLESEATVFEWTVDTTVKFAQFDVDTLPKNPTNLTTTDISVIGSGVQFYRFRLNEGSWSTSYPISTPIKLVGLKSGNNTISIIGGDSYGNWQSPSAPESFTWEIDANVKVAVLENKPANPTNSNVANITVAGVDVINYMYSIDGGATWSDPASVSVVINLPALVDGAHSIRVVGGDKLDTWQNKANATVWNWYVDTVAPVATLTSTISGTTNVNPVPATITFSEPVAFELSKLVKVNCNVNNLREIVSGKEWTFDIFPINAAPVSVTLTAGVISDFAGNPTAEDVPLNFAYDSVKPTATLSPADISPTNAPITMTLYFNKQVSDFALTDLTVVNGVPGNLTTSIEKQEWTFDITPSWQGEVTVGLAADKVTDSAGNGNTAANPISFIYDSIMPTVVLSTASPSPTNASPIPVLVTFSENVSGFAIGDLTVGNCTASNLQVVTASKTWSFDVTPGQGEVTVGIAAGVVADAAGNTNSAALPIAVTYDSVRPSATLATTVTTPTSASPIPVAIEFSEVMPGFLLSHLTITNGTAGNLQLVITDKAWTFDVVPSGKGEVVINLLENKTADPAGNGNFAAMPISVYYDSDRPAATLTTTANPTVNTSPITVFVEFNKDVVNFDISKLTIGNGSIAGSASVVTPFRKWSFLVNASGQGAITVDLAANKVLDSAGNGNTAAAQLRVIFDSLSPTVSITSTSPASTNSSSIPIRIEFSDAVIGFDVSDLVPGNCTVGSFQLVPGTLNKVWTAVLTPGAPGAVTVGLPADSATDAAGNGNTAATPLSRNYDIDRPTVALSTSKPDPTNANPIPVTVTFNEEVTGFNISQLVVGNGSAGNLQVAIASRAWTVDITPNVEGFVTLDMPAGNVTDAAGNSNEASLQLKRYYDSTRPMAALALAQGYTSPASGTFKITVTFNEDVTGFTANFLSVLNGSPQNATPVVADRSWTVEIVPSVSGSTTIDIDLGADKVTDASGNGNAAAARLSVAFDNKAPTAILTTPELITSTEPIPVTIEFDEPVSGLTLSDFAAPAVVNCVVTNLQPVLAGTKWIIQVKPSIQGNVSVRLPAGKVVDAAGNGNVASNILDVNYNSERPTVSFSSVVSPTKNKPITTTITFSEAVTGFAASDLVFGNGSVAAGGFTTLDDTVWTLNITPTGDGLVTVDIPASSALDIGGNGNTAAAQFSVTYDSASPTVVLSTTSPAVISSGNIPVTIKFNEDIDPTSFIEADLTVTNGAAVDAGSLTGSGKEWACTVTPVNQGVVSITLAAGRVTDPAGNGNTAANTINVTYDTTRPTALLEVNVASYTSSNNAIVSLTFSKPVTGFTLSDLLPITNGIASNLQPVGTGNSTWTFTISAVTNGLVALQLPENVASDTAGNGNVLSNALSWNYDSGKPSVALTFTPPLSSPVNGGANIGVTVTFSEEVSGFIAGELVVGNGTVSNFTERTAGKVWTASITPTIDGLISVNVAADIATDAAGNGNTAATQISVTRDTASPTATLTTTAVSPTRADLFPVTITFNENVTGFDKNKLNVVNGSVSGEPWVVTANRVWRANIAPTPNPPANQLVTIDLLASAAADMAGNPSVATGTLSVTHDPIKPTAVFATTAGSPASTTVPMTVTFSEPVTGLVSSDFTVAGNAYVNTPTGGPSVWTFSLIPTSTGGAVTLNLGADKVIDAAGNGNTAAPQFSIFFDNAKPSVILSTSVTSPTKDSPIPVTITFSEVIATASFIAGDLVIGNGTAGTLTTVDNIVWTVGITPTASGTVTVNLPAGVASDTAGNGNTAAAQLSVVYDATPPTVTIATATVGLTSPTNINPIPIVVEFSEIVSGFTIMSELVVVNGTISNPVESVPGKKWLCNIVPVATGTITMSLAANVASDTAGNGNIGATPLSIVYDSDRPTVVFSAVDGGLNGTATNTSPIPFKVTFNKSIKVDTLTLSDIVVTNGVAANLTSLVAGTQYTFAVTPNSDGPVYVNMAENKVTDETMPTGNYNTAAAQFGRVYDTASPAVVLSTATNLTNGTEFDVTVTFFEDVRDVDATGLITADFAFEANSGQVMSVVASVPARVYTVRVKPLVDPVKMKLPAGKVRDLVGNYNSVSNEITVTYDTVVPTVTLTSTAPDPTNGSPIPLTITFSERVTGFTASDLSLGNATLSVGISENSPGLIWSANLIPLGDGDVTASISAAVAKDLAGNDNTASNLITRKYDGTRPGVTFSSSAAPATKNSPIPFTVTFTEIIATSSFALTDISVSGGTATDLATGTDGLVYSFIVTPSVNGTISVTMAANQVRDLAGNLSLAATPLNVTYDTVRPTVTLASDKTITNGTFLLTVTFSEVINGFGAGALTVNNCSAAPPVADPLIAGRWTVVMTATGDPATVKINENAVTDLAGNGNTQSALITVSYDNSQPGLELSPASLVPTNVRPIVFTVLSDEFVNGLAADDFEVSPATATVVNVVQATAGRSWNVSVNFVDPNAITIVQDVSLTLKEGAVTDLAGNINPRIVFPSRLYDSIIPTFVNLTGSGAGTYFTNATIWINIVFSEPVFVTGAPRLQLNTQPTFRWANYVGGSGGTILQFSYTVLSGDSHIGANLDYTTTSALALNGGTIRDQAGNNANLTLPGLGSGSSLAKLGIQIVGIP